MNSASIKSTPPSPAFDAQTPPRAVVSTLPEEMMVSLLESTPTRPPPTLAEVEAPSQALLSQLKESLIHAGADRQNYLNENMKLTVHYNAAIINPALSTEGTEAARPKFEQIKQRNRPGRAEDHHLYQPGVRAQ
ncbi:hypothetical protein BX616_002485, partial [Lobosporangium transversale]